MFLNKMKEQQEKNGSFSSSPVSHYQTALLTIPTPGSKIDGGGQVGGVAHLHPAHGTQNMLTVPSTGIMTAGEPASQYKTYNLMVKAQPGIRRTHEGVGWIKFS